MLKYLYIRVFLFRVNFVFCIKRLENPKILRRTEALLVNKNQKRSFGVSPIGGKDTELEELPFVSCWDGVDLPAGIYHSGSWLQQQLVKRSFLEELLKLPVAHFLQSLHTVVVQHVGASVTGFKISGWKNATQTLS